MAERKARIDASGRRRADLRGCSPNSGSAAIGAKAGYPSISQSSELPGQQPAPVQHRVPRPAWSEPTLGRLAYAYEQATKLRQPPPRSTPNPVLPDDYADNMPQTAESDARLD